VMQWTVRLETTTSAREVKTTEQVAFSRPAMVSTLAEVGLVLAGTKTLLARLQASMPRGQVAEHAAHRWPARPVGCRSRSRTGAHAGCRPCSARSRSKAPRFKLCRCREPAPMAEAATFLPVCTLLTARCTPELERMQAELGARTSFRNEACILKTLLPASPATHESVRIRTHAVALRLDGTCQGLVLGQMGWTAPNGINVPRCGS